MEALLGNLGIGTRRAHRQIEDFRRTFPAEGCETDPVVIIRALTPKSEFRVSTCCYGNLGSPELQPAPVELARFPTPSSQGKSPFGRIAAQFCTTEHGYRVSTILCFARWGKGRWEFLKCVAVAFHFVIRATSLEVSCRQCSSTFRRALACRTRSCRATWPEKSAAKRIRGREAAAPRCTNA